MAILISSFHSPTKPAYMEFIDVNVSYDNVFISVIVRIQN